LYLTSCFIFLYSDADMQALRSFPTRRSSDLSALNSIFIIFFSQLSALILLMFTTGFGSLDLSMLLYMLPGGVLGGFVGSKIAKRDRKSTRLNSSHVSISYAVFCLKE